MTAHILAEDLSAFLDGALPAAEMPEVVRHLAECVECRRKFQALQQVGIVLRQQPPVPVPPFFAQRLANRIRAQHAPNLFADFVWLGKRLMPALALLLVLLWFWAPFESAEPQLQTETYLTAAGASSAMSLLAANNQALTQEEVLELVVLSSSPAQQ